MKHRYMISCASHSADCGIAQILTKDIERERPIRNKEEVEVLQGRLRRFYANDTLIIIAFSKYED